MNKKIIIGLLLIFMLMGASSGVLWDIRSMFQGTTMIPAGAPWLPDDGKLYFGDGKDGYIFYNSTSSAVEISGISVIDTTGVIVAAGEDITYAGGDSIFDASAGSGVFKTTAGAVTVGPGAVGLTGDLTIAATKGITKTAGAGNFDFSAGSGTFKTSYGVNTIGGATVFAADKGVTVATGTSAFDFSGGSGLFKTSTGAVTVGPGAITLSGDVDVAANKDITMAGTGTFTSGTGIVTINGVTFMCADLYLNNTLISANNDITYGAGNGAFDAYLATGIFNTSTGTNTLNGNVTIVGAKTFTTGTGDSTFSGDVIVADGKDLTMHADGTGTFGTGAGAVAINGATTFAANKGVAFSAGTGAMDLSLGTGVTKTTTGLTTVSGAIAYAVNATTTLDTVLTSSNTKTVYPMDGSGASVTLELPTAASTTGRPYIIAASADMGGNNITVSTTGAGKLGGAQGADTLISTDATASLTVISDGTNYLVVSKVGSWS